nr:Na+/H+ antiporter NhaA [Salsipaludibacter albus]
MPPGWRESDRFVPRTFVQPALSFFRLEASGGILMLIAAVVALAWANSPIGDSYFTIFESTIEISFGGYHFHHLSELTVQEWINDAAMVIFFFVVGLEIKREVVVGDLRDPRAAALPAIAALGGMVVPAAIYLLFNVGGDYAHGWGIPMATDIAFAVGVVSMVGSRVPVGAKLFLLALAIVDDVGAIAVIALVYTTELAMGWLLAAVAGLVAVWGMNRAGIRALPAYLIVGTFVWLAVLESGVHATIAGVALALLTPVTSHYSPRLFAPRAEQLTARIDNYLPDSDSLDEVDHHTKERVTGLVTDLRRLATETVPPLDRTEHALAPWSSYVVVPIFALANAGVVIDAGALGGLVSDPVTLGVALGLVVGKFVGVFGFAWMAVRTGLGRLPHFTTWTHVAGLALLAGIGFTVALFVASLAFEDPAAADAAKIGIFAGSLVAGLLGFGLLRWFAPGRDQLDADRDYVPDAEQVH